jgi:hypothetical protein
MIRTVRRAAVACALTAGALGLAGCGGGGSPSSRSLDSLLTSGAPTAPTPAGGSPSTAAASAGGAESTGGASDVHYRIANFYAPRGKPGPGLDIYDVQLNALNGAPAKPILTDVAYGTVSAYAVPREVSGLGMKTVQLEALPTGENPDTQFADASGLGGLIDDGSGARLTEVLTTDENDAEIIKTPLAGLSFSERMEAGDDGQGAKGPAAPPAAAGQADLLVDDSPIEQTGSLSLFLAVDKSCAPPLNGDTSSPGVPLVFNSATSSIKSDFAIFQTTPGTHSVSIVSWTSSTPPTCHQLSKLQGTTSVALTSGEQAVAFVYGTSTSDLHLAVAPIAN